MLLNNTIPGHFVLKMKKCNASFTTQCSWMRKKYLNILIKYCAVQR